MNLSALGYELIFMWIFWGVSVIGMLIYGSAVSIERRNKFRNKFGLDMPTDDFKKLMLVTTIGTLVTRIGYIGIGISFISLLITLFS